MAIINRVKWDGDNGDILAWRFDSSDDLSTSTQLIVNESQEAFLVKEGVYQGPFGPGRHTLSTENIPLLRTLMKLPFGGKTPFSAEVWYTNLTANLNVLWGTPDPIQLQDPKYKVMIPVRAFGQYAIRVNDSKKFLLKLVGTIPVFDSEALSNYFRGALITKIKTQIASAIIKTGMSVLEINTELENLSNIIMTSFTRDVEDFGVELIQFNVHSINIPEDDPAVMTLKGALARRAKLDILGSTYQQERSFDVLEDAASNEANAGNIMGAGMGLGMGVGIGQTMGSGMSNLSKNVPLNTSDVQTCSKCSAQSPLNSLFCISCGNSLKKASSLECPGCNHEVDASAKFCGNCGFLMKASCAKCNSPLVPGAKFCPECGEPTAPKKPKTGTKKK
jgi:membrane protease subunit (stomatin/prohibitin family)